LSKGLTWSIEQKRTSSLSPPQLVPLLPTLCPSHGRIARTRRGTGYVDQLTVSSTEIALGLRFRFPKIAPVTHDPSRRAPARICALSYMTPNYTLLQGTDSTRPARVSIGMIHSFADSLGALDRRPGLLWDWALHIVVVLGLAWCAGTPTPASQLPDTRSLQCLWPSIDPPGQGSRPGTGMQCLRAVRLCGLVSHTSALSRHLTRCGEGEETDFAYLLRSTGWSGDQSQMRLLRV
jgi:hypothetical protein